jgi:putative ABC transport system ATP-binding protein
MQIKLNSILPVPLKENFLHKQSDIWNTDCTFSQQEWVKIKAPSGSGKTTLIHILYKLRNDYEGQVFWNNNNLKDITGNDLAILRQQNISIIFQDLRLFPQLTARENIELKRVLQKPVYESGTIDEMAEKLGVAHVLNQKAGICSYGEQQRIAIIRALMQPFNWLLMDEPFSHLDQKNIGIASALIAEECIQRKAGIFLTDLDDDTHFSYTKCLTL